jgi:hypothetical protein
VLSEDITDVFGFKEPTAADVTEVHPETPDPNTKTAPQLEAVERHAIAILAISFSGEIYRC